MTKPTKWPWAQRRLGLAWASAQSDQSSLSAWRNLGSLATRWAQWRCWSDWADAQADQSLRWAHGHFVGFVMSWLKCGIKLIKQVTCHVNRIDSQWIVPLYAPNFEEVGGAYCFRVICSFVTVFDSCHILWTLQVRGLKFYRFLMKK